MASEGLILLLLPGSNQHGLHSNPRAGLGQSEFRVASFRITGTSDFFFLMVLGLNAEHCGC